MTQPRREWIRDLAADPAVLSAVRAAAETCMREVCERHEPSECSCAVQMCTPLEFAEWLELTIERQRREPLRLDHRENRQAGQSARRVSEAHLAVAG